MAIALRTAICLAFYAPLLSLSCFAILSTAQLSDSKSASSPSSLENPASPISRLLNEQDRTWIAQHSKVRVRISTSYPPFEFFEDDHYQGMAYDYLRLVGQRLGIEFQSVEGLSWSETLEQIRARQSVDLILMITHTKERENFLHFTRDYINFPELIYTRLESPVISGIEDLSGKIVAIERGFIEAEVLMRDVQDVQLLETETTEAALEAVASGRADAYVGNLAVSSYLINKRGFFDLKVAAPVHNFDDPYAMAVRKDWPQLAELIDKALTTIDSQEQRHIRQKWLSIRYEHGIDWPLLWRWASSLGGALSLIIVITLYWNRRLSREVVERRNAEIALLKSEKRFRSLIKEVGDDYTIYSHDLDGRLGYVSPSAEDFYGIALQDLLGRHWLDFTMTEQSKERAENSVAGCHRGETPPAFELEYLHPDGNLRYWMMNHHPVLDESGAVCDIEGIIKDITATKQAEQELTKAKDSAERASQAKSSFLSHMAHELRAPLTAILGYTQLLQRSKELPESAKIKVENISQSGQQLRDLISDVLEVSRIEASRVELKPMAFNLYDLLDNLAAKFRMAAEQKGLDLEFVRSENLPPELICDQEKLRQILINLLTNAIIFSTRGSIVVEAELKQKNGAMLVLKVKDSGPGIAPDKVNMLFRPFGQITAGAKKDGSGLGLIISREYARQMGGDLMVSSEPGKGSTFTLSCRVFENGDLS